MSTKPLRDLAFALRQLHRHAGEPSSREIARATNYSHTTVAKVLRGDRRPSWPVLRAIVRSLHGNEEFFRSLWVSVRDVEAPLVGATDLPSVVDHWQGDTLLQRVVDPSAMPLHERISNARFVEQRGIPQKMDRDETLLVSITMMNNGTTTWSQESAFHLGSQTPQDNELWLPNGGNRIHLPIAILPPSEKVTFVFRIRAPRSPGIYVFQWRMLQESVTWFGDRTSAVEVSVV
ncbi:NBR1-Ig-like domain-containing protein [Nocardia wallacei]|uniref:NBR1-Ig-like domain-containing protein n=1 Tax=Nocardia wallacei TaxID=480035 RepID=UPI003CC8079C